MNVPLEGGCLCGAVRYRISAVPHDAGYCHCRICQRSSGAPVMAWLVVTSEGFAWIKGEPAAYRSSAEAERLFCRTCGSQLAFRAPAQPHLVEVTLASLDQPEVLRPVNHIWTSSRIGWFDTRDVLPRHAEHGPT